MFSSETAEIKEFDMPNAARVCSVVGCSRPVSAAGMCSMHYQRQWSYGDPLAGRTPNGAHKEWVLNHVDWRGEACLLWPFARNAAGYAFSEVARNIGTQTKSTLVHRVMCELRHGKPPTLDHQAAHSCGKGADGCVNPNHLRWATRVENEADKVVHGTHRRPDRQVITDQQAKEILTSTESNTILATRYGVSKRYVNQIRAGIKRAAMLGLTIEKIDRRKLTGADRAQKPTFGNRTELSEEAIAHIKASSEPQAKLAARFGVGQATISRIKAGTYQSQYRKEKK